MARAGSKIVAGSTADLDAPVFLTQIDDLLAAMAAKDAPGLFKRRKRTSAPARVRIVLPAQDVTESKALEEEVSRVCFHKTPATYWAALPLSPGAASLSWLLKRERVEDTSLSPERKAASHLHKDGRLRANVPATVVLDGLDITLIGTSPDGGVVSKRLRRGWRQDFIGRCIAECGFDSSASSPVVVAVAKVQAADDPRHTTTRTLSPSQLHSALFKPASERCVLQRFVRTRGAKACLYRVVWRRGQAPFAWAMCSRDSYLDFTEGMRDAARSLWPWDGTLLEDEAHKSPVLPQPVMSPVSSSSGAPDASRWVPPSHKAPDVSEATLVERLAACHLVTPSSAGSFTTVRVAGQAIKEPGDIVNRIAVRIEAQMPPSYGWRFQEVVCDFVKDVAGTWWLLQVFSYELEPASLTMTLRMLNPDGSDDEENEKARMGDLYIPKDSNSVDARLGGGRATSLMPQGRACRFCRARYRSDEKFVLPESIFVSAVLRRRRDVGSWRQRRSGSLLVRNDAEAAKRHVLSSHNGFGVVARIRSLADRYRREAPMPEMSRSDQRRLAAVAVEEEATKPDAPVRAFGYDMTLNMMLDTVRHLRLLGKQLVCHEHLDHAADSRHKLRCAERFSVCRLCLEVRRATEQLDTIAQKYAEALCIPLTKYEAPDVVPLAMLPDSDSIDSVAHGSTPYTAVSVVNTSDSPPGCSQFRMVLMFQSLEDLPNYVLLPTGTALEYVLRYTLFTHTYDVPCAIKSSTSSRRISAIRVHFFLASTPALRAFLSKRHVKIELVVAGAGGSKSPPGSVAAVGWLNFQQFAMHASALSQMKVEFTLPLVSDSLGTMQVSMSVGIVKDDVTGLWADHLFTPGGAFYWPPESYWDRLPIPDQWMGTIAATSTFHAVLDAHRRKVAAKSSSVSNVMRLVAEDVMSRSTTPASSPSSASDENVGGSHADRGPGVTLTSPAPSGRSSPSSGSEAPALLARQLSPPVLHGRSPLLSVVSDGSGSSEASLESSGYSDNFSFDDVEDDELVGLGRHQDQISETWQETLKLLFMQLSDGGKHRVSAVDLVSAYKEREEALQQLAAVSAPGSPPRPSRSGSVIGPRPLRRRARQLWALVREHVRKGALSRPAFRGSLVPRGFTSMIKAVMQTRWMLAAAALGVNISAFEDYQDLPPGDSTPVGRGWNAEARVRASAEPRMLSWRELLTVLSTYVGDDAVRQWESRSRRETRRHVLRQLFRAAGGHFSGSELECFVDIGELRAALTVESERGRTLTSADPQVRRCCVVARWLMVDEEFQEVCAKYDANGGGNLMWDEFVGLADRAFRAVTEPGHVLAGKTQMKCRRHGRTAAYAADLFCCRCEAAAREGDGRCSVASVVGAPGEQYGGSSGDDADATSRGEGLRNDPILRALSGHGGLWVNRSLEALGIPDDQGPVDEEDESAPPALRLQRRLSRQLEAEAREKSLALLAEMEAKRVRNVERQKRRKQRQDKLARRMSAGMSAVTLKLRRSPTAATQPVQGQPTVVVMQRKRRSRTAPKTRSTTSLKGVGRLGGGRAPVGDAEEPRASRGVELDGALTAAPEGVSEPFVEAKQHRAEALAEERRLQGLLDAIEAGEGDTAALLRDVEESVTRLGLR